MSLLLLDVDKIYCIVSVGIDCKIIDLDMVFADSEFLF